MNMNTKIILFIIITNFLLFNIASGQWAQKADMPTARAMSFSIAYKDSIYVFGGDNSGAVEVYTPKTDSWTTKSSFPGSDLNWSGAGLIGDTVYAVIGIGSRDNTKYHVIAAYSLKQDKWTKTDSTTTAVNDPAVAVCGRSIFMFSGFVHNAPGSFWNVNTVKEFNIDNKQWIIRANIPVKRHAASAVTINSKIYVFGGVGDNFSYPPTSKFEIFDPETNAWLSKPNTLFPLAYFRSSVIGSKIYFCFENRISVYDTLTQSWSKETNVTLGANMVSFTAFKNGLYFFGGTQTKGQTSETIKKAYCYIPDNMITDFDGNIYRTIKIGTQSWMQENLKSVHYSDGSFISEAYINSNDSITDLYGRFYTWKAAMNNSSAESFQGACPDGYHVPSEADWNTLTDHLGGADYAAGKLKETGTSYWKSPNTGATNQSGFTALPGGFYAGDGLTFSIGDAANIWTSKKSNSNALIKIIENNSDKVISHAEPVTNAFSVRCIKNEEISSNKTLLFHPEVLFYPNPCKDEIWVSLFLDKSDYAVISFCDIKGREVYHFKSELLSQGVNSIHIDGLKVLKDGMYFFSVKTGLSIFTGKIIKNKSEWKTKQN